MSSPHIDSEYVAGCLPRAIWIAPVGVMNFAGYELAKKAIIEAEKKKTQFEQNVLNYDGSGSVSNAMTSDHSRFSSETHFGSR